MLGPVNDLYGSTFTRPRASTGLLLRSPSALCSEAALVIRERELRHKSVWRNLPGGCPPCPRKQERQSRHSNQSRPGSGREESVIFGREKMYRVRQGLGPVTLSERHNPLVFLLVKWAVQ